MSTAQQGNQGRLWAIAEISRRVPRRISNGLKVSDYFGCNTFNAKVMAEKLPKDVHKSLVKTMNNGHVLDQSIAAAVAHAVKEWAIEKGATHYCHWFQPNTGITAEKHDTFLTIDGDGQPIERFSASQLVQSEPDASSFPSGGMRATFEARGYTAWDPNTPIFIMESTNGKTLCIPSVFISYHGQALDKKTPLLRSVEYLSRNALRVLKLFGKTPDHVEATLGPEQEYFLIDDAFYSLRPDLVAAGRTLIGAKPPKGQELEDQYFGSIKSRVLAFMQEFEHELFKLGVPVKTRHNEVAPSQYETAPVFELVSVATDHNQLTMEMLRRVARRHNLAFLIHEKPFAGINGSGKHNNWSMATSDGENLLDPGATPSENLQFLVCLMATLKGVYKHSGLLRASIASSGNDHRLGANEAPPAIISAFLGDALTKVLDSIEAGDLRGATTERQVINLGIAKLPEIARDNTDRNRTSPFAFTGNKFEFRAVPSSASTATPMATLNAAVGEALGEIADAIEGRISAGEALDKAVIEVVREWVIETRAVRFEGNNYAEEWVVEAERRGLPNLRKTPEALAQLQTDAARELFTKAGVYSVDELESRYHLETERYIKDLEIEIAAMQELAATMVLPAAYKHQALLASSVGSLKAIGVSGDLLGAQIAEVEQVAGLIADLKTALAKLEAEVEAAEGEDLDKKATALAYPVSDAMAVVREACDKLENTIDDTLWPLPKYREMLFLV
ncbi:MAG: glutamine synthetase III [Acidobacteria bacterium]|nr:glutamine synthetase III [Acidobacteriota bacterium]MCW5969105.1 glutamine synthetase III [Blastocatellales bacterium]